MGLSGLRFGGLALLLLTWLCPAVARAQLEISLKLKHRSVLQFEAVQATVEVLNRSRKPFIVASDVKPVPDIQFLMVRERGKEVQKNILKPVLRNVYILPGKKETFEITISRWYNMSPMGQYIVKAAIDWQGKRYFSNQLLLEVVRGIEILSKKAPVFGAEHRTFEYGLRYWKRERAEHIFLTIDDVENKLSYGVFHLGPVIRVGRPKIEIDSEGGVKTIHQSTPSCYAHTFFKVTPARISLKKQSYHLANGSPCP